MSDLEMHRICKAFGGVQALVDADFTADRGEVHALLGENGAGKSTLIKVLSGAIRADAGEIKLFGQSLSVQSPKDAIRAGIGTVYQELSLIPALSVATNIFFTKGPVTRVGSVPTRIICEQTRQLFERFEVNGIDPTAIVEELPLPQRQLIEIVKILAQDTQIVVFDEPTSGLSENRVQWLLRVARQLAETGKIVIFISHRMGEIQDAADRVSVFRSGRSVGVRTMAETDPDELVALMLGGRVVDYFPEKTSTALDEVMLETRGLHLGRALCGVDLQLHAGEVLGVGGLAGQGQAALFLSLFGIYEADGDILIQGKPVNIRSPRDSLRYGLALMPEDRTTQGLIQPLSISHNIVLPLLSRLSRFGLIEHRREAKLVHDLMTQLSIKADGADTLVMTLSGGNQQKVVFAKLLSTEPHIFLIYDSTRGVDVGTKAEIYGLVQQLAARGNAILFYSTDTEELVNLCDRVLVMHDGKIGATLSGTTLTKQNIMRACIGEKVGQSNDANQSPGQDSNVSRVIGGELRNGSKEYSLASQGFTEKLRQGWTSLVPYAILLGLIVVMGILNPELISLGWLGVKTDATLPLLLVSAGQTLVLLTGGLDLSVGGIMSLANSLSATQMNASALSMITVSVAVLAMGLVLGALNGILIVYARLQPFIATLATWFIWSGTALFVLPTDGGDVPKRFVDALLARTAGIPISLLIMLALAGLWEYVRRTRFGSFIFALGSQEKAVFLNGVNVKLTTIQVYALAGMLASSAGLFRTAQVASGSPTAGNNFILASFAAAIIGGVRLGGGKGSIIGTIIGAFILRLISDVLVFAGVSAFWTTLFQGALLITAVAIASVALLLKRRGRAAL